MLCNRPRTSCGAGESLSSVDIRKISHRSPLRCVLRVSATAMETSRCLKLVLPFLDAVDLVRSSVSCKDLHVSTQQSSLWEGLCHSYTAEIWQTQRGDEVEFPEREDGESAKQYFERLYERYIFFRDCDTVRCNRCNDWTSIGDDGLECEDCKGIWCDKCAIRGPSKHWLPCKDCPDFSKTHCLECFHDGKTLRCECHGTDSWSHCCGRHAFNCEKCNATLCRFCVNHHSYDCPEKDEEEEDELHPAN